MSCAAEAGYAAGATGPGATRNGILRTAGLRGLRPRHLKEPIMRNRISIILLASLLAPAAFAAPTCGGHGNKDTMLVSAAWLSAHLKDPNLVVLSIGSKDEYAKEHIPGTQMISLQDVATPMVMGQL